MYILPDALFAVLSGCSFLIASSSHTFLCLNLAAVKPIIFLILRFRFFFLSFLFFLFLFFFFSFFSVLVSFCFYMS
ncbi:hypothetical protein BD289DRAFT_43689 [Coniella lustricola]|uniref:Uncharacterized protein n=1 Tax=Coniella lustricola TaxID=2025994 RepID=A0A2T3A1V4_9PEZI|nr:hypothetical protein BD289DRAFT_43689 [Coniella lustricola]